MTKKAAPPTAANTVPVQLDRLRHMRLTLRDAFAYQKATATPERPKGISLFFGQIPDAEDEWVLLIHTALVWEDPSLTVERVPDILEVRQLPAIHEALASLLEDFRPARGAGDAGPSGTA